MSKKKSLGSSPIGLKSENKNSTMGFIPDLGVADSKKEALTTNESSVNKQKKRKRNKQSVSNGTQKEKKDEKKVVSYNLEVELIENIKSIASEKDMYYSSLVSLALKSWIAAHSQS